MMIDLQARDTRPNLYNLSLPELERLLGGWDQPAFRARQLYRQLYKGLAASPTAMTDLPLALRERLAAETTLGRLELERDQTADAGLTRKALWRLDGGAVAETVLMVYPDRATACVSTQAGCAMGCVFCATGKLGLLRNLSSGEIVAQAVWASRVLRETIAGPRGNKLSNLVFMGMGEPFANYDRWWAAVERLHDPDGLNMGARTMTVSTVGLVPGDDELRSALMPINKRYPIAELLAATRDYTEQTRRRVSFEYVLLQNRNDSLAQAAMLAKLLRGLLCHVNIIPWNPVPGMPLERSQRQRVLAFQEEVQRGGVACTVRVERGVAIAAACGQLAGLESQPVINFNDEA
jgi:23S rRNA (adenine2503-C2)-methyltransferase